MNQSIALPNPIVESNLNSFAFDPNLYDAYFYHSDHLGSSNYISNNTGIVSQHTEYLPFGETLVDEHLNSHNTPFKFNAKEFDDEIRSIRRTPKTNKNHVRQTGNYYYGARYYNPKWITWLSVDPLVEQTMDAYGYCYQNPLIYIDPDGASPISVLLKQMLKVGAKKGLKEFGERQIKARLQGYAKMMGEKQFKKFGQEFAKDLDKILGELDSEWWETAIELIPVAGDAYGGTQFAIKLKRAYDKLQDLENKYVDQIYRSLPASLREKFKAKMRRKGVADAKKDQMAGARTDKKFEDESIYKKGKYGDRSSQIDGHHIEDVLNNPSMMSDPRNIFLLDFSRHVRVHRDKDYKPWEKIIHANPRDL
jgi:RHS repeat-associated protein